MPQTTVPYLCVADGAAALDWYRRNFGATISNVYDDNGRVGHAEIEFAGNTFYLADEHPEIGVVAPAPNGTSVSIMASVANVDAFIDRAIQGGAKLQRPIQHAHGSRNGWIIDPFGHRWNIGTPDRPAGPLVRRPAEPYYFTISASDVDRAASFYGQVLDWQFVDANEGARHISNTTMPMGVRPTQTKWGQTSPGEIQVWFTVRDFDDAVDRVRIAGGTVLTITSYDSGREAHCADDQGVEFRLSEPAPGYDTN